MTLQQEFNQLKTNLANLSPESRLTATITAENTGKLMDLAINENKNLVEPFAESPEQNHWYFQTEINKNVILKVKSKPKNFTKNDV